MNGASVHGRTVAILFIGALLLASFVFSGSFRALFEDGTYFLSPSAARAYEYGSRHFDARYPARYDIERAEYFLEEALVQDPQYPNALHQLSRIAFLKGDFGTALARINAEIVMNPDVSPSSYYVRGLIKGYMDDFEGAAKDYEVYLKSDPNNWAAINDYAWVLLKAGRPLDALVAVDWGLGSWPDNPWLLNSKATAHFELGQLELADEAARRANENVQKVTELEWLQAYPGNDSRIAPEGVAAFRQAVTENMHTIELALEKSRK